MRILANYAHWMTEGRRLLLADAGIFFLRVWLGLSMALLHGQGKLQKLTTDSAGFPDPLGVGATASLGLAVFAEVFCSFALVAGLFTRLALTQLIATMVVAFFIVHGGALSGERSGELAFIYLAGYVALFITGPGRFSIDHFISNHFRKAA